MGKKLGGKLILAIFLSIFVTVLVLNFISIRFTKSYGNSILIDQTVAYVNSMNSEFKWQQSRLTEAYELMELANAVSGNADASNEIFEQKKESDSDFGAIFDASGNIVWKSESFSEADFDATKISAELSGIIESDSGPALLNSHKMENGGLCVLGMRLDGDSWLDELKEETGAEYSVFNGKTCYATTLADKSGNRAVGTDMADKAAEAVIGNGKEYSGEAKLFGQNYYVAYCPLKDIDGKVIGALFSGISSAETEKNAAKMILVLSLTALGVGVSTIVISTIVLTKTVLTPVFSAVREGLNIADDLNRGKLSKTTSNYKPSNDEMGDFVKRLDDTVSNLGNYIGDMSDVLAKMSEGDFTARPQVDYVGDFIEIKNSFDKIGKGMSDIMGGINDSSRSVLNGSSEISEGAQMLANGSTKQASAVEQLSASVNNITEKVQKSADNATRAGEIAQNTSHKIADQNVEVQNMLSAMSEIETKSDKIKDIIKAIDDIAFQTNILALNAAIEASRAGDAGKGFAVVADEVRNLAAKSAESAKQTGDLINTTISAVQKGTVIARKTAETMKEVTEFTNETNQYISDIAAASVEQAESIKQIKIGIEEISSVVQQNSATAEQTAASCVSLNTEASNLETRIETLKVF